MPVSSMPHSSWAEVYDFAYKYSFGSLYSQLTDATIEVITNRIKPPAKIVDFGAGTGRLSIPLAKMGYKVVAVEPCAEMLTRLEQKRDGVAVTTACLKMEEFVSNEEFEFALCVFTVLLYLLDEEALIKSMSMAYASLKPKGRLLIDIPSKAIFQGFVSRNTKIERSVSVTPKSDDVFNYQESIEVKNNNGVMSKYKDEFLIRYWREEKVLAILKEIGFILAKDLSSSFVGTGSSYYIMRKA